MEGTKAVIPAHVGVSQTSTLPSGHFQNIRNYFFLEPAVYQCLYRLGFSNEVREVIQLEPYV